MAQMQTMAPKMQEIREKYAGDQKKMQEELAKIGGLKAFGGCLPMFLQMPIWIGLYGALLVAIQLRHSAFLPSCRPPGFRRGRCSSRTCRPRTRWSTGRRRCTCRGRTFRCWAG